MHRSAPTKVAGLSWQPLISSHNFGSPVSPSNPSAETQEETPVGKSAPWTWSCLHFQGHYTAAIISVSLKKSSLNSDPDILLAQQLFAHGRQTVLPRCAESPRPLNFNVNEMNCIVYSLCVTGTVPSGQCCTWLLGGLATCCSLTCEAVRAPLPVIRSPSECQELVPYLLW